MVKAAVLPLLLVTLMVYQTEACFLRSLSTLFDSSEEEDEDEDILDSFLDMLGLGESKKPTTSMPSDNTTTTSPDLSSSTTTAVPPSGNATTTAPANTTATEKPK